MGAGLRVSIARTRAVLAELAGPLVLAALVFALFGGVLVSGGGLLLGSPRGDMLQQYLPWRVFGFSEMAAGNLALWNPHIFSGRPFLGDFQSALLYPPNLVHLLLSAPAAINLTLLLHLALAGTLSYAWARRSGVSRPAATLAGTVAMLGGAFFLHLEAGHLTHVCTMAWAPGVLLCLDEARRAPDPRHAARWLLVGMAATALQVLAGHPQFAYYTALVSLALALAHAAVPGLGPPGWSRRRLWLRSLGSWVGVWSGGALLAAAQVLAGVDTARESGRWQVTSVEFAGAFFLPVENLVTLVAAHALGGGREAYYGRWLGWEVMPFVGAATLVLAALARGRRAAVEGAIVAAAFLVALGPQLPGYEVLFHLIPGFQIFRAPARLAAAALPVLALLAARGLDQARRAGPPPLAPVGVALSAAAIAGLAWLPGAGAWTAFVGVLRSAPIREVAAEHLARAEAVAVLRALAARELLAAAAVLALCALLLAAARRHPRTAYAVAVVAGAELVAFAAAHRFTAPPVMPYPELWRERAAAGGEARVRHVHDAFSNQGMVRGHRDVWGYDASVPARYSDLLAAMGEVAEREGDLAPRLRGATAMLRWRHLFGARPDGTPAVLDLGEPLPRALLVEEVAVVPDRAAMLRALLDPGFDPRRTVLLETPPAPWPDPGAGGPLGQVHVLDEGTDVLDLEVEASRAAVLLVTDAFARGWSAKSLAEGAPARYEVLPANVALQAVPLPAGRHRLRLEYAPTGFRVGRVVSVLAILAWMSGLALVLPSRTLTRRPRG